jgi:hypothetical protein
VSDKSYIEKTSGERLLKAFIHDDESIVFYIRAWRRLTANGPLKFGWYWSWWGLFAGPFFLIYRRKYALGGALLVPFYLAFLFAPAVVSIVFAVLFGGFSAYPILQGFDRMKKQLKDENEEEQIAAMTKLGGSNRLAYALYIAFAIGSIVYVYIFRYEELMRRALDIARQAGVQI